MYGVGFQSGSRNLTWKVWEIFVVVAEGDHCVCWANRKGRMGLWQEGRGQGGKEEGAQPSFALGGTVSSVGEFPQHLLLPGSIFAR